MYRRRDANMRSEGQGEDHLQRRLAAILAADIAGYSALMSADEARTVRDLKEHQAVVLPMIQEHGGRVIDTAGDGILAEFGSVVNAAECAVAIQRTMAERNSDVEESRRMRFRIGITRVTSSLTSPASMATVSTLLPALKTLQSP